MEVLCLFKRAGGVFTMVLFVGIYASGLVSQIDA